MKKHDKQRRIFGTNRANKNFAIFKADDSFPILRTELVTRMRGGNILRVAVFCSSQAISSSKSTMTKGANGYSRQ